MKQNSCKEKVLTHVDPKQELEEHEMEMELNNQYVYNHHQFATVYFDHMH